MLTHPVCNDLISELFIRLIWIYPLFDFLECKGPVSRTAGPIVGIFANSVHLWLIMLVCLPVLTSPLYRALRYIDIIPGMDYSALQGIACFVGFLTVTRLEA